MAAAEQQQRRFAHQQRNDHDADQDRRHQFQATENAAQLQLIGNRALAQQRQQRIQQREQRQQGEGEDPHLRGGDDHRTGLAAALQPQRRTDADDHPLQQQRHALEQFVLGDGLLPDALRLLATALKGGQHHPVQHGWIATEIRTINPNTINSDITPPNSKPNCSSQRVICCCITAP